MSTLEDASILNGTVAQKKGDTLLATFVLPDGEEFQGEFQDEEQMRKLALSWCETVRGHWEAKVARKLDPIPGLSRSDTTPQVDPSALEEIVPVTQRERVSLGGNAQQMIIDQYYEALERLEEMAAERDSLNNLITEAEELANELEPLAKKWGAV